MEDKKNKTKKSITDLLNIAVKSHRKSKGNVIYGIYDSASQPFWIRLNDFLVDHSRVSLEEKTYFFHLLAVMIDAGIPILDALKMLANRTNSERFRRVLNTVAFNVVQGKKLSDSMARFPDIFDETEIGIMRAGEAIGNLDKMLFKLSRQLDKSHSLQIKMVTASIYPLAVLVVLILVAGVMLTWVVPSLVNLLKEGGLSESQFPFATRLLLVSSAFVTSFWWLMVLGAVILYLLFKVYISSENGRFKWDHFKLKVPIIGTLLRRILVLRFASNLGILIESGLPVVQALTIIAGSLSNELYKLKVWEVISKVQQGEKISSSLLDAPFLFPETIAQMIAVGEQSASIGVVCDKISRHYEREIDNAVKRLTSLFQPIMIVFVGLVVAVMALAILTPIFSLSELV